MASKCFVRLRSMCLVGNYQLSRSVTLSHKAFHRLQQRSPCRLISNSLCHHSFVRSCSTSAPVNTYEEISVRYDNGLPVLSVPLPSRREKCQFTLKPFSNTLGDFINFLQEEDHGIDRVAVYAIDGERVAKSTPVDILLHRDFHLVINDERYLVNVPLAEVLSHEHAEGLADVKNQVAHLYSNLNIEAHQVAQEQHLLGQLNHLRMQMEPLEKVRQDIELKAKRRTNTLTWVGLGMMGIQFGILARLTWWEYSWDIMEPVTYFITYGTSIAMFSYYVVTKQEYLFPDVKDREHLLTIHRRAKKVNLDIDEYNRLRAAICQCEYDIQRLRDPLQINLPIGYETPKRNLPEDIDQNSG